MFIEDSLSWSYHVNYITKSICHKIWIFKKVLHNLSDYVLPLYYNAFIISVCSYCLIYWLNNDRSDRHKQTEKIDAFISKLVILFINCNAYPLCMIPLIITLLCLYFWFIATSLAFLLIYTLIIYHHLITVILYIIIQFYEIIVILVCVLHQNPFFVSNKF